MIALTEANSTIEDATSADPTFYEQFKAEVNDMRKVDGRIVYRWKQIRDRNEATTSR